MGTKVVVHAQGSLLYAPYNPTDSSQIWKQHLSAHPSHTEAFARIFRTCLLISSHAVVVSMIYTAVATWP